MKVYIFEKVKPITLALSRFMNHDYLHIFNIYVTHLYIF